MITGVSFLVTGLPSTTQLRLVDGFNPIDQPLRRLAESGNTVLLFRLIPHHPQVVQPSHKPNVRLAGGPDDHPIHSGHEPVRLRRIRGRRADPVPSIRRILPADRLRMGSNPKIPPPGGSVLHTGLGCGDSNDLPDAQEERRLERRGGPLPVGHSHQSAQR